MYESINNIILEAAKGTKAKGNKQKTESNIQKAKDRKKYM